MLIEQLIENPKIQAVDPKVSPITATYGAYRIMLSNQRVKYFKDLQAAEDFLAMYYENVINS
jgi:hypothetical protein